ncbi:hypothetical protein HanIR_Chr16g0843681 [Helianthus annuus]|nr:hypothetical protein HanIR_Chr16g0843681 [Helianthus annuus]
MKSKCYEFHLLDTHAPPAMKLIFFNFATSFASICSNHRDSAVWLLVMKRGGEAKERIIGFSFFFFAT